MLNDEYDYPKPEHPQADVSWLSYLTFFFTIGIFKKGLKKDFDESDLTEPLDSHKSSTLGENLAQLWNEEIRRPQKQYEAANLHKPILKMFYKEMILQGLCLFIMEIPIRLCQPLFLGLLLRYFIQDLQKNTETHDGPTYFMRVIYFEKKQSPIQTAEAYFFASGIIICSLLNIAIIHPCTFAIMNVGMKIRVACCSLIYRKTLRIDLSSLTRNAVGNVINLISNDVNRFDLAVLYLHYIWIAPLQLFLCLFLLYKEVLIASVYGICGILVFVPLQAWFGNRTSRFRLRTAYRTDERIKQMNEIIQGMQVIKMYTWEYAFVKHINELRRKEISVLRATSFIRGTITSFIMFISRFAIYLTVLAVVLHRQKITVGIVFVVSSFYLILRQTMTVYFPLAIAQIAETNIAITRIKRFLLTSECSVGDPKPLHPERQSPRQPNPEKVVAEIKIRDAFVKIGNEICLKNISLEVSEKRLIAIIGEVGSGKSSLLNLILGELRPLMGSVDVRGVISYASQEPWLFPGSLRQNILFGRKFERERYRSVVIACALLRDFRLLPFGDGTIVGENGMSLSGGQRARINLARAVYKKANIYLFDDPLSAVDVDVGKHLFDKCIDEFLSDKIVILVTHQIQFLKSVNKIILMHDGRIEAEGSYEFLKDLDLDFMEFLRNQLSEESSEPTDPLPNVDAILKELILRSQISLNVIDVEGMKYTQQERSEAQTAGSVSCYVFKEYFKASGNCCLVVIVILLFLAAQMCASSSDFFLAAWARVEEQRSLGRDHSYFLLTDLSTKESIIIYTVLVFLTMIVALSRSLVFFTTCMRASVNLHNRMFQSIVTASMRFFNTNTSGCILNRFSKDLGSVDETLPNALIDCVQIILSLVGAIVVVTIINYYLIIPTIVICILIFFLRRIYIKTSKSIKRLEAASKSPVFGHLNATIQGITTIRSNGQEMLLAEEFDNLQDDHSSAWFMFIAASRAFGYWLDILCIFYIAFVCYSFLLFPTYGSNVGLAITQAIGLTGFFQWGMKQSAELENQMIAVERVLEYTRIEHEPDSKSEPGKKPPPNWPTEGKIEFQNLVMRYKPEDPPVLQSLSFIGIVGRTGAGKSSLISALFRLGFIEGTILIDDLDTVTIGLHDLRSKISIIPQEPVLFSGTIRYNMDPFHHYDDDSIVKALQEVEIKSAITEGAQCLEHFVTEGGANISVGERQMICLARAILRNNKILVLDEATANIDPKTDKFIQTIIRNKFADCTVLTIAHRLHTIMDSDRVLVMDAGAVVEFDHPHQLLRDKFGVLSQMIEKTGTAMAQNLREIAEMSYKSKYGRP